MTPENEQKLRAMLIREEGKRFQAYADPLTGGAPWTIGVGHTGPEVHPETLWTEAQVNAALAADIETARTKCMTNLQWFPQLDDVRQAVLIAMAFQLGMRGLLGFRGMLDALRDQRWHDAAGQALNSLWARQTPKRAQRMARQIETGAWQ